MFPGKVMPLVEFHDWAVPWTVLCNCSCLRGTSDYAHWLWDFPAACWTLFKQDERQYSTIRWGLKLCSAESGSATGYALYLGRITSYDLLLKKITGWFLWFEETSRCTLHSGGARGCALQSGGVPIWTHCLQAVFSNKARPWARFCLRVGL